MLKNFSNQTLTLLLPMLKIMCEYQEFLMYCKRKKKVLVLLAKISEAEFKSSVPKAASVEDSIETAGVTKRRMLERNLNLGYFV